MADQIPARPHTHPHRCSHTQGRAHRYHRAPGHVWTHVPRPTPQLHPHAPTHASHNPRARIPARRCRTGGGRGEWGGEREGPEAGAKTTMMAMPLPPPHPRRAPTLPCLLLPNCRHPPTCLYHHTTLTDTPRLTDARRVPPQHPPTCRLHHTLTQTRHLTNAVRVPPPHPPIYAHPHRLLPRKTHKMLPAGFVRLYIPTSEVNTPTKTLLTELVTLSQALLEVIRLLANRTSATLFVPDVRISGGRGSSSC
ncbi:hypothetical protein K439DRAFT_1641314 [Ramaria rubella]|nr:hypothetical protein K439DRAFT_1641314 [Ramaria rubella]